MKYIAIIVSLLLSVNLSGQEGTLNQDNYWRLDDQSVNGTSSTELYITSGNTVDLTDSIPWICTNDNFVERTSRALNVREVRVPAQLSGDHELNDIKAVSVALNLMGTKRTAAQIADFELNLNEAFGNYGREAGGPHHCSHPARAIDSRIRFKVTKVNEYNYTGPWTQTAVNNAKNGTGEDRTKYMNVWVYDQLLSDNGAPGLGGFAYLAGAHGMWLDGIVIRGDLLTHFAMQHEAGHYFNLYHTFNQGCSGAGDFIADTPFDAKAGGDVCGQSMNTCTNDAYTDNFENYMDYGRDACKNNFTPGQSSVMYTILTSTRSSLLSNQPDTPDDPVDDPDEPAEPNVVFTGITAEDGKLTWTVEDEVKIFKYQVQRSDIEDVNWHTIHEVTNVGSDSYMVDIVTESGYRVRAIQNGGKVLKYSPMVIYRPEEGPEVTQQIISQCELLREINSSGGWGLVRLGHPELDVIADLFELEKIGSRKRKRNTIMNYVTSVLE